MQRDRLYSLADLRFGSMVVDGVGGGSPWSGSENRDDTDRRGGGERGVEVRPHGGAPQRSVRMVSRTSTAQTASPRPLQVTPRE